MNCRRWVKPGGPKTRIAATTRRSRSAPRPTTRIVARCHDLEAISGGIAPDLRKLDTDCSPVKDVKKKAACVAERGDYHPGSLRRGKVRDGAVYMPPFEGILTQEAMWAIKAYHEARRDKPL